MVVLVKVENIGILYYLPEKISFNKSQTIGWKLYKEYYR